MSTENKEKKDLLDYACAARLDFNRYKNKVGEAFIHNKVYPVYEYDIRDLYFLDNSKTQFNTESVIAMIIIAIPDCPIEDIFQLTKMEAANLAAMIYSRIDFTTSDYQDYIKELN